jgi:hypothetical protein
MVVMANDKDFFWISEVTDADNEKVALHWDFDFIMHFDLSPV